MRSEEFNVSKKALLTCFCQGVFSNSVLTREWIAYRWATTCPVTCPSASTSTASGSRILPSPSYNSVRTATSSWWTWAASNSTRLCSTRTTRVRVSSRSNTTRFVRCSRMHLRPLVAKKPPPKNLLNSKKTPQTQHLNRHLASQLSEQLKFVCSRVTICKLFCF